MNARHPDNQPNANSLSELSDSELAVRVRGGDDEAFEILARRYLRPVYAVVSSFLSSQEDIDDSAQDTFLRALEKIHSYNPNRPFAPWLYQVARNVARNRWKYLKKRQHEELEEVRKKVDGNDPSKLSELSELRSQIAEAIESLPERQRTAFRLHDVEGFKATEIAEMLGVSDGTVRANLHHARRELRKRLKSYQIDRD
jgi:RNA polymerase sigma-70 factor (ECF subfamily)